MPDDTRRTMIDRANRMLRESKALRKTSDDLLKESKDLRRRSSAKGEKPRRKQR